MTNPRPGAGVPLSPNARLRFDVLRRHLVEIGASSFLEVGCGQGAAAAVLARHLDYVGYEPDPISYGVARGRLDEVGAGRVVNGVLPEIPDRSFDVVGAFEVLEHLEDDRAALAGWVRWLRPGGHLLISVPAHPERYGPADVKAGHFRRYTRRSLTEVLESAGLVDVRITAYGFPLGYLLEWVRNRVASRAGYGGEVADVAGAGVAGAGHEGHGSDLPDVAQRTAASGRWLQPGRAAAALFWLATLPFLWVQRPFGSGARGTGFVARGRLPA